MANLTGLSILHLSGARLIFFASGILPAHIHLNVTAHMHQVSTSVCGRQAGGLRWDDKSMRIADAGYSRLLLAKHEVRK